MLEELKESWIHNITADMQYFIFYVNTSTSSSFHCWLWKENYSSISPNDLRISLIWAPQKEVFYLFPKEKGRSRELCCSRLSWVAGWHSLLSHVSSTLHQLLTVPSLPIAKVTPVCMPLFLFTFSSVYINFSLPSLLSKTSAF